jgi:hypothetical protein
MSCLVCSSTTGKCVDKTGTEFFSLPDSHQEKISGAVNIATNFLSKVLK